MSTVNKAVQGDATPSTKPTNHSLHITKESAMTIVRYITDHIKNQPMTLTELIEAQAYTRYLARKAGVIEAKPYIFTCNLAPKNELGLYESSDFAAEGWKRCFDTLQVGVMPMKAEYSSVRRDWYKPEEDGYPADVGGGQELVYHCSKAPRDEALPLDFVEQTPIEVLDADYDDSAADTWLAMVEGADSETSRIVALAGGLSTNSDWLL